MAPFFRMLTGSLVSAALAVSLLIYCQPRSVEAEEPGGGGPERALLLTEFPDKTSPGALPIYVIRVDPRHYRLKLLSASEHGGGPRSLKMWSEEFGLHAAINASMYQDENTERSTGFMKNFDHLNNQTINPGYGAFMVFNPKDASLPPVQFVDRRRQPDWKTIVDKYQSVIQNYRMISDGEQTGWPPDGKAHSTAALGMDGDGNVLFIFSSMPRSTHDFIGLLLNLPLGIRDAMYAEGGAYAGMYRRRDPSEPRPGIGLEHLPSLKVPNVLGVVPRR